MVSRSSKWWCWNVGKYFFDLNGQPLSGFADGAAPSIRQVASDPPPRPCVPIDLSLFGGAPAPPILGDGPPNQSSTSFILARRGSMGSLWPGAGFANGCAPKACTTFGGRWPLPSLRERCQGHAYPQRRRSCYRQTAHHCRVGYLSCLAAATGQTSQPRLETVGFLWSHAEAARSDVLWDLSDDIEDARITESIGLV